MLINNEHSLGAGKMESYRPDMVPQVPNVFRLLLVKVWTMPNGFVITKLLALQRSLSFTLLLSTIFLCKYKKVMGLCKSTGFYHFYETVQSRILASCVVGNSHSTTVLIDYCLGLDFETFTYLSPLGSNFFMIMHFVEVSYKPY